MDSGHCEAQWEETSTEQQIQYIHAVLDTAQEGETGNTKKCWLTFISEAFSCHIIQRWHFNWILMDASSILGIESEIFQ